MPIINGRGRVGIRKPNAATPSIVLDGLKLYLDAGNAASYPGTGTVWTDISGNGYDGTLSGVNGTNNTPNYNSANGGYFNFDGTDDCIFRNSLPNFNVGCIDMWIKPKNTVNASSAFMPLIQLYDNTTNTSWYIALGSATSLVTNEYITIANVANDQRTSIADGGSLLSTNWYNIVFNWESTQYKIYINNSVKTNVSGSRGGISNLFTTPNKYLLGGLTDGGSFSSSYYSGNISNTRIYNRSLSASEITQNYNAMLGRFYPVVSDADAQAFVVAAGLTSSVQANAVNSLVTSLKSAGIWAKMKAVYPFVGGSAASHKWNLKDPRDLNAAYRLNFAGTGWVHSSTGMKPNGTSDYANTFLNPSTTFADFKNNGHLSIYSRTQNPIGNGWDIGVGNSDTGIPVFGLAIKRPTWSTYTNPIIYDFGDFTNNGRLITTYNDARGFWIGSTTASNSHKIYRNGSTLITSSNVATGTISNSTFNIGRLNNTASSSYLYMNNEYSFASIGDGLTDTEAANFYTAVQAYQTALGRQV